MATIKKSPRKPLAQLVRETGMAKDYSALLAEVRARIQDAQYSALRAVHKEVVDKTTDLRVTTSASP